MEMQQLELLASSLRVLGLNLDVPTLDVILTLRNKLEDKQADISLAEIHSLSVETMSKYNTGK